MLGVRLRRKHRSGGYSVRLRYNRHDHLAIDDPRYARHNHHYGPGQRLNTSPELNGRTFTAADTLKNLVVRTRAPGATVWELAVIGVPGDRNVDLKRLAAQLEPTEVEVAGPEDLERQPGLVAGYIGPQLLASLNIRLPRRSVDR